MKKILIVFISGFTLLFPLIVIMIVYFVKSIKIFDNPDFWYGYMAYFGTVLLAGVSFWQNENANITNKRIMNQQLRQKIGYFDLKEARKDEKQFNRYQNIQVGQIYDANFIKNTKDCLVLNLTNVGEDVILNPTIIVSRINGYDIKTSCSLGIVYKNETIKFDLGSVEKFGACKLSIDLAIQMKNITEINYIQNLKIELQKVNTQGLYTVEFFNTEFNWSEHKLSNKKQKEIRTKNKEQK